MPFNFNIVVLEEGGGKAKRLKHALFFLFFFSFRMTEAASHADSEEAAAKVLYLKRELLLRKTFLSIRPGSAVGDYLRQGSG